MNQLIAGEALWLRRLRLFFMSPWSMALEFVIAAVVTVTQSEIVGVFIFLVLILVLLVLCDNILALSAPFLLCSLFLIKSNSSTAYSDYSPLAWLVVLPLGALIAHFALYHRRMHFVKGRAISSFIAVSVSLLLGGVGFIPKEEYFAGTSLYHMLALGVGMLVVYLWLSCALEEDKEGKLPQYVANLMCMLGLFACFMVFHIYLVKLPLVLKTHTILAFQWRNNVSTFLMLSLPFPFYQSFRRPMWLLGGLLMYLALLLSGSRGGLVFGTLELAMCVIFVLFADKKRRLVYLCAGISLCVVAILGLPLLFRFFGPTIQRLLLSSSEQEVRMQLYRRALEDFLAHPIFGTGMGYMGNRDIHPSKTFALCWYHCSPLQIIGSLGIVGVAAYAYHYVMRLIIFLQRRTKFHLTLFLSWVGIEMMSLVNPGVFAPVPYLLIVTMFLVFAEKIPENSAPALTGSTLHPTKTSAL